METTRSYRLPTFPKWFKSYYVVWKQQEWKEIDDGKDEFKSYYVVWKLIAIAFFLFASISFKSYYVVWKLITDGIKSRAYIPFKSYYVVWKPRPLGAMCFGGFRLNRTMQYGNKSG